MMYLIGVDAGGSKCQARITTIDGKPLGEGITGPANLRLGTDAVKRTVKEACFLAVTQAGLPRQIILESHIGVGMAGVERHSSFSPFSAEDIGCRKLEIVTDAEIANLGAHKGEDGGCIVVGTGTVAIIKNGDQHTRIGGLGFPASDLGSGAHIGLTGIQHALRALDGLTGKTEFLEKTIAHIGSSRRNIIEWLDQATPTHYATVAPIVVTHADRGDATAMSILRMAAHFTGEMLLAIRNKGVERLCLQGGLGPIVRSWLEPEVGAFLTDPFGEPIDGAVTLARQMVV